MTALPQADERAHELAASAAAEWANLVTTAVLGTDRRPLPHPPPGWESVRSSDDPAVELLHRAAAVATARRAGVRPGAAPLLPLPAPDDDRPPCPAVAANALARMLRGEHDILLPEWMARCAAAGFQLPLHLVPALLLRGRRNPGFDRVARALIGPLAAWLADAVPDLGVSAVPKAAPANAAANVDVFAPPLPPPDSGAMVSVIVGAFIERTATWAAIAQLRLVTAALDPAWLPALELELNRAPFHAVTERVRVDLLGLCRVRREVVDSLTASPAADVVAWPRG